MAWDMTLSVQAILRNEMLDERTCDVCMTQLDGIVLPADDPAWAGELGLPAHYNCRYMLVPIFEGIAPVLEPTALDDLPQLIRHLQTTVPVSMFDGSPLPIRDIELLHAHELTIEDLMDILEPPDLILKLFGLEG